MSKWLRLEIAAYMLVVVVGALTIGVLAWEIRGQNERIEQQVKDNEEAIETADRANSQTRALTLVVESERMQREREIARALAIECRENEEQDVALVLVLRAALRQSLVLERTPERSVFINALRDAITTLEPDNEPDCRLP
jgi:hypothetical protein